jgi:hypothetical protein
VIVAVDVWSIIGSVSSVIAAIAASVAVWLAKATVDEARASRRDGERGLAELLARQQTQLEAMSTAHHEEMTQRAESLAAERELEVIRQLQRIAGMLQDLADCARDESVNPPRLVSEISPIPLTRIPGLLARLQTAVESLRALAGPNLPGVLGTAEYGYNVGTPAIHFVGEAIAGLREVESAISAMS